MVAKLFPIVHPPESPWREVADFFVPGVPRPGGSKRGFIVGKRVIITDACKGSKTWKDTVAAFAADYWRPRQPLTGILRVEFTFYMPRPMSHYRTGTHCDDLRADAPRYHSGKPDVLKLSRSTEDALSGIVWRDDCLIADERIVKMYGTTPGALIAVYVLSGDPAAPAKEGGLF